MAKLTLNDITAFSASSLLALNANWQSIEDAIENTLSRDGTSPNAMEADLDLNDNRIINIADGELATDAVTLQQLQSSTVVSSLPSMTGNANRVLMTDGIVASWRQQLIMADGTLGAPTYSFANDPDTGMYLGISNSVYLVAGGTTGLRISPSGIGIASTSVGLNFSGAGVTFDTTDPALHRDANNTLAQRQTTSPQAHRLYNTFTDAANYERLKTAWESNSVRIQTEQGGTGVSRSMILGTTGSGNIFFRTNDISKWQIDSTGHFLAGTDNTLDIGASGAQRPRILYLGSDANIGGNLSVTGTSNLITLGTPVTPGAVTFVDFLGIPAGTKRVTIMFSGLSFNGAATFIVQLGISSGIDATSTYIGSAGDYVPTPNFANHSTGFGLRGSAVAAASTYHGTLTLTLMNSASNIWIETSSISQSDAANTATGSGSKTLSGALDRVRITTSAGTATIDAGSLNITYEK